MNDDFKVIMAVIAIMCVFFASLFVFGYFMSNQKCVSKWEAYQPSYSYWLGCKIIKDGKSIPADTVREVQ